MGIPHYLAMTAAELSYHTPPENAAWLACHFSSYHKGVSNLPGLLPPGSLVVLDDSVPIDYHDPETVKCQLWQAMEVQGCRGLLLDFQRADIPQAKDMAAYLTNALPCPVAVSHLYASGLNCPVFLPPPPLSVTLEDHLQNWRGREIWLETALSGELLTLTKDGCATSSALEIPIVGFAEETLHCHYSIETGEDSAIFTLWRTREDLDALLEAAENAGVTLAVGLWQELRE